MDDEQNTQTTTSIYGANAITGSKEDADHPDVTIIDSPSNQQIQVGEPDDNETEGKTEGAPDDSDNKDGDHQEEPEGAEGQLRADIDESNKGLKAIEKTLKAKGVDFNKIIQEYDEFGGLTPMTRDLLNKNGYPNSVIDSIISGREALNERWNNTVYGYAGGQDSYEALVQWAGQNLSQAECDAFNHAIDSNDLGIIRLAIQGLQAQRTKQFGTARPSVQSQATAGSSVGVKGFATRAEMVKAMSDKRYGVDRRYTKEVEARMVRTSMSQMY